MRFLAPILLATLASWTPGQDSEQQPASPSAAPRLRDSIESPYAYVAIDAVARPAAASDAVRRLLADPALDVVFGSADGSAEEGEASDGARPSQSLAFLRRMLVRGASEIELLMTGIVPSAGRPLLVLRARLGGEQADKLRDVFRRGSSLVPNRRLGGCQTYTSRQPSRGPGEGIELALVGDDLLVGNDSSALREVLDPRARRTRAQADRKVLSGDPRFQALRAQLDVPAGTLLAYGDWQRLGKRLQSSLPGVTAQLLASSGLASARSVMVSVAAAPGSEGKADCGRDFDVTLLLDFDRSGVATGEPGIDGWFAATQPVTARQLLRELPRRGLGGMVLSVDLASVAVHSRRSSLLLCDLRDAFTTFGLDFERNVLGRLLSRGTVQLHFSERGGADGERRQAFAAVSPIFSVRTKSRRAAEDLFDDLSRVVQECGLGKRAEVAGDKLRRRAAILDLHGRQREHAVFATVADDALFFAESQKALVELHEELQRARSKSRRKLSAHVIKAIGGEHVAGLFDVDLDPLFRRISAALPGADLSSLPRRHIGYLATDDRESGAVVRVRLLSSL